MDHVLPYERMRSAFDIRARNPTRTHEFILFIASRQNSFSSITKCVSIHTPNLSKTMPSNSVHHSRPPGPITLGWDFLIQQPYKKVQSTILQGKRTFAVIQLTLHPIIHTNSKQRFNIKGLLQLSSQLPCHSSFWIYP